MRLLPVFALLAACGGPAQPAPSLAPQPEKPVVLLPDPPLRVEGKDPAEDPAIVHFAAQRSELGVMVRRTLDPPLEGHADLGLQSAMAMVEDGQLTMLHIVVGDAEIAKEMVPPRGIVFRDIELNLVNADCDAFVCDAELELTWSLAGANGSSNRLRPIRFKGVQLTLQQSILQPALRVEGHAAGAVWNYGGIVELADLTFMLTTSSL